jgi:hypothetical protein
VHFGHGARDQRIELAADLALPAGHCRDIGLHRGVAFTLRDLGIAAGEQDRLCDGFPGSGLVDGLASRFPDHHRVRRFRRTHSARAKI